MGYGDVGLIVARLQGKRVGLGTGCFFHPIIHAFLALPSLQSETTNTIIGDKWFGLVGDSVHEIVLKDSSQCLPLVCYKPKSLYKNDKESFKALIETMANIITSTVDLIFNSQNFIPAWKLGGDPNKYIGQRVAKYFYVRSSKMNFQLYFGTIDKFSKNSKLWHVSYDDGDEEEFDFSEISVSMFLWKTRNKVKGLFAKKGRGK